MKIIEDITYSIDDVVDQINRTFGFTYDPRSDHEGSITLGSKIKLDIVFEENERKLKSAQLVFPTDTLDFTENAVVADTYTSSIESATQIVDLIKRMLSSGGTESDKNS